MTLFVDQVRGLTPAVLGKAVMKLTQCKGCLKDGLLFLHGVPGPEPIYVGQVRNKLEGYEALLRLKELGLGPQPEFLAQVRAAVWLKGEMPTLLELPTAGEVRDYGRPDHSTCTRVRADDLGALTYLLLG